MAVSERNESTVERLIERAAWDMARAHGYDWPRCTSYLQDEYRARARSGLSAALPTIERFEVALREIRTMVSLPYTKKRGLSDARLDAVERVIERVLNA